MALLFLQRSDEHERGSCSGISLWRCLISLHIFSRENLYA